MALPALTVREANVEAAFRLVKRMFTGPEQDIRALTFGSTQSPIPIEFADPENPFTKYVLAILQQNMLGFTTYVTVEEWRLDPNQVDQLQVEDPRITSLKERIKEVIAKMPTIVRLREDRIKIINATTPN